MNRSLLLGTDFQAPISIAELCSSYVYAIPAGTPELGWQILGRWSYIPKDLHDKNQRACWEHNIRMLIHPASTDEGARDVQNEAMGPWVPCGAVCTSEEAMRHNLLIIAKLPLIDP